MMGEGETSEQQEGSQHVGLLLLMFGLHSDCPVYSVMKSNGNTAGVTGYLYGTLSQLMYVHISTPDCMGRHVLLGTSDF